MSATIVAPLPSSGRIIRKPSHTFQIRHRPFQIQPFALAPVLPGETMKNALIQARIVSDPVKNPLVGWWYEMYLFYVKHRDMPDSTHFQNMVLSLGYDMTPVVAAAKTENYHSGGTVDWVQQCLDAVVPHYFRDDGEAVGVATIGNQYAAKMNGNSWLDSILPDSQMIQGGTVTGTAGAVDLLMQQWELMRSMKLTTMTYEEFLSTYGVRPELRQPEGKPELIRYVRDWNYPSNTVNPVDGSAASALSWAIGERAEKDRYFSEPGFIFGCAVARPKVYVRNQVGNASQLMADAMSWLPALLAGQPQTSLKKVLATAGPLAGTPTEAYWVDVRDILVYGDQFLNFARTETNAGIVALPTPGLQRKYPSAADVDALFVTPATQNLVRADGILSLQIAGSQKDHT